MQQRRTFKQELSQSQVPVARYFLSPRQCPGQLACCSQLAFRCFLDLNRESAQLRHSDALTLFITQSASSMALLIICWIRSGSSSSAWTLKLCNIHSITPTNQLYNSCQNKDHFQTSMRIFDTNKLLIRKGKNTHCSTWLSYFPSKSCQVEFHIKDFTPFIHHQQKTPENFHSE